MSEHGGTTNVLTTQIAPTILRLHGLNRSALQAVRVRRTHALPHA